MNALVAQVFLPGSIGQWAICIIIVAAIVAVFYVILQQMNVQIPPFIVKIFWIVLAAVIGIVAIGFLLRLGGLA